MKQKRFWVMLLLVMCLVQPATVWSEELEKSAEVATSPARQEECPGTFGPILTDTTVPADVGALELQPFWYFISVIDSFSPSWRRTSAGGDFYSFGFDLQITYGAWENLEVFTVIPMAVNWASSVNEPGPSGDRSASYGGFGDVNLTFKYLLLNEGPLAPAMSAIFATDFPTGHYKRLNPNNLGTDELGGGSFVFTTGLNLAKWIKPFIFYGNLYYSMPTSFTNDDGKQEPRDFVTVNLAAEYPITEKWIALLELTSAWDAGRLFGPHPNIEPAGLVSILPGIEFMAMENLSFAFGVNVDLAGKNTDATVMPILSLVWAVH
ncbi:MAG: transporter [Deltaproteobacteria bacterium]|nr:MAG: transporter [Deltaproteobacteria bacterium]